MLVACPAAGVRGDPGGPEAHAPAGALAVAVAALGLLVALPSFETVSAMSSSSSGAWNATGDVILRSAQPGGRSDAQRGSAAAMRRKRDSKLNGTARSK